MLALKANAVSILLGVMLVGTIAGGYKIHQLGEEKRQGLEDSIQQMTNIMSDQEQSGREWMKEAFKLDEKNTKIMGDLNDALQGNPNIELWLVTRVPDDVTGWVWDFYEAQYQGENFPADYVPATRKKAIALGLDNRDLIMTTFETVEALNKGNLQFKKLRELYEPEK